MIFLFKIYLVFLFKSYEPRQQHSVGPDSAHFWYVWNPHVLLSGNSFIQRHLWCYKSFWNNA